MTYLEAHHMALDLVKKAGFILHTSSGVSEACYYYHPARRPLLLRIATHAFKGGPIGLRGLVVAKATYSRKELHPFSEAHVNNVLAMAIGRYFLGEPKPANYYGKKGTWTWETAEELYDRTRCS